MAEKDSRWGSLRPGRRTARDFRSSVSPLGKNVEQDPCYSPDKAVEDCCPPGKEKGSEYSANERRGG